MSRTADWLPLRTARLTLRDFRESDFEDVHAYAVLPEVVQYMNWGPNTEDQSRAFLERAGAELHDQPRRSFSLAMERSDEGRVIGAIRLGLASDEVNADFGYSIHPRYWGKGYATEAARALLQVAFESYGVHRVWATCDVRNAASYRVMERLGMRREGRLREHERARDGWRDSYVYAVLESEWGAGAGA